MPEKFMVTERSFYNLVKSLKKAVGIHFSHSLSHRTKQALGKHHSNKSLINKFLIYRPVNHSNVQKKILMHPVLRYQS